MDLESYNSITEHCGWLKSSQNSIFKVSGIDRISYIHGLTTNDIKKLILGQGGCYAAIVNKIGKMSALLKVKAMNDYLIVESDIVNSGVVFDILNKYVVSEDVVTENITDKYFKLEILGANSASIIKSVFNSDVSCLKNFDFIETDFVFCRTPYSIVDGFEIIGSIKYYLEIINQLTKNRIPEITFEMIELFRIESGIPKWGVDYDSGFLPMEAGLESITISYSKGCYIGQEVIQRVKTYGQLPRQLRGLELITENVVKAPASVYSKDKEAGKMSSCIFSPRLGKVVGLATLIKGCNNRGAQVRIGSEIDAVVIDLPMIIQDTLN